MNIKKNLPVRHILFCFTFTTLILSPRVRSAIKDDYLSNLPTETIEEILSHLGQNRITAKEATKNIARLAKVNQRLREVAHDIASQAHFEVNFSEMTLSTSTFASAFQDGSPFATAKNLNLRRAHFDHALLERLPVTLTELNLDDIPLTLEDLRRLIERLRDLTKLHVEYSNLDTKGAALIAKGWPQLQELRIRGNKLREPGVRILVEHLKSLQSLNVCDNELKAAAARSIAESLPLLRELDICANSLGDEGLKWIAEKLNKLELLEISSNSISENGIMAFKENTSHLRFLYTMGNRVNSSGVKLIAKQFPDLEEWDLSRNELKDTEAQALAQEAFPHLRLLDLEQNRFSLAGIQALLHRTWPSLETVKLSSQYLNIKKSDLDSLQKDHPNLHIEI